MMQIVGALTNAATHMATNILPQPSGSNTVRWGLCLLQITLRLLDQNSSSWLQRRVTAWPWFVIPPCHAHWVAHWAAAALCRRGFDSRARAQPPQQARAAQHARPAGA
jgi:hypothetical protein